LVPAFNVICKSPPSVRPLSILCELSSSAPVGAYMSMKPLEKVLRPIAGFRNPKDDEDDPEDSPRLAELVLSDDARLLPLRASVPIVYLPLTLTLAVDCSQAPCSVPLP
jgi:hypothetical protein